MSSYKIIGLMSGTSLDGLDIAYCHIWKNANKWAFDIKKTDSIPYSDEMRENLKNSIYLTAEGLLELDVNYGIWLGRQVKTFIRNNSLEVDFIASHGHTTHHRPEKGFTYQIGAGQYLANISGQKVICDFRSSDVAAGGQGAPLVPIGDKLFFSEYDFCLNLGGICNVSFEKEGERVAYDIGLANMILNYITSKIELKYDRGGEMASRGRINQGLLLDLNKLEYYSLPYPKSTGYEWFVQKVVPILNKYDDSIENLLHTSVHHICEQVAKAVKSDMSKEKNSLFATGGGALNTFLISVLKEKLEPEIKIHVPAKIIIEFKEALVFALMGALKVEGEYNVLSSVTGAVKDSINGISFYPV